MEMITSELDKKVMGVIRQHMNASIVQSMIKCRSSRKRRGGQCHRKYSRVEFVSLSV